MGCCSSSKSTIKNVKNLFSNRIVYNLKIVQYLLNLKKNKEQSQEQETCAKPSLNKKKTNQLICFQVQQDNIQNKDNLNAVDDEFLNQKLKQYLQNRKRNSDSDY